LNAITRFKQPPFESEAHLDYVRSLPCCICYRPAPSVAHHVRIGGQGGTSKKPGDDCTVPLCDSCHKELHQRGEHEFITDNFANNRILRCELWLAYARSHVR
jgi:hypothetical protein